MKVYKSIVSHTMHCIKITLTLNCTAAVSVYLHEECCSSLEAALHLDESSVCRSCRQMHPSCRSLHLSAPQLQVAAGLHAAVGGCQESDDWDLGDLRLDRVSGMRWRRIGSGDSATGMEPALVCRHWQQGAGTN